MTVASEPSLAELSRATGLDLDAYRASHVGERIGRALERERVSEVAELAALLRRNAEALARFRHSVAVSVSGLFRDPVQFRLLEEEILPSLLTRPGRVRVWSAGCADGTELYSVAMLLERAGALERSSLLGTDLLEENVAAARAGAYLDDATRRRLRAFVRWQRDDLTGAGAPPRRWNLVLCRNVAIYLAPAAKQKLHAALADALACSGVLLLGRSERVADPASLGLAQIGPHAYRRTP